VWQSVHYQMNQMNVQLNHYGKSFFNKKPSVLTKLSYFNEII